MPSITRLAVTAAAVATLALAPTALRAQASVAPTPGTADSLAFPRQFVKWIFSGQGDSAWAHAGAELRASMQSAEQVSAMGARITSRFGESQGTDAEVQFDDGGLRVYIVVLRLPQAPEPGAWLVAYDPATHVVMRSSFSPLSRVRSRYPDAKLP